jgi:mycothiol synthase
MTEASIRPYQPEDIDALHRITLNAAEHDGVDPHSTLESIPTLDELLVSLEANHADPASDVFVAVDETTKDIVGYGKVGWWQEEDGTFLYLHQGVVDPAHRHKGAGSQLLASLQERIREIAASHPGGSPKMLGTNASETEQDALKLIQDSGYEKVWSSLEMEFSDFSKVNDIEMPAGFELRPVESDEEKRKVYEANKRVYEGTWGAEPSSEEDYQEFLAENPDASLWKVAWDNDKVAGFVLSKVDEHKGEITQVSVLPEYRRRGLGQSLMAENIRHLHADGVDLVRLHTDSEGKLGGRQMYESLGFSPLKESYRFRKPL